MATLAVTNQNPKFPIRVNGEAGLYRQSVQMVQADEMENGCRQMSPNAWMMVIVKCGDKPVPFPVVATYYRVNGASSLIHLDFGGSRNHDDLLDLELLTLYSGSQYERVGFGDSWQVTCRRQLIPADTTPLGNIYSRRGCHPRRQTMAPKFQTKIDISEINHAHTGMQSVLAHVLCM
jgi:hypothetical protein